MARFDRLTVLNAVIEGGLVPVFYHSHVEVAKQIVGACVGGGARVVEFTNRGDRAWSVFTQLTEWVDKDLPGVILGDFNLVTIAEVENLMGGDVSGRVSR